MYEGINEPGGFGEERGKERDRITEEVNQWSKERPLCWRGSELLRSDIRDSVQ